MRSIGTAVGTDSLLLKKGYIGCPETSVRNYHYSLCNNPGECSSLLKEGVHFEKLQLRGRIIKGMLKE